MSGGRVWATVAVGLAVALWSCAVAPSAPAEAVEAHPSAMASVTPATDYDQSAAVSVAGMLDRLLGAGNSHVVVTAQMAGGTTSTATHSYAAGIGSPASAQAWSSSSYPGSSVSGSALQAKRVNALNERTTTTVTGPGLILQQSIAVTVNSAATHGTSAAAIRRLVAAATGLMPARGDRLTVVIAAFPPATRPATATSPGTADLAVTGIETAGGVLATLILMLTLRPRRRPVLASTDGRRIEALERTA